jgi:DNA polymerase-3 subunit beta
MFLVQKPHLEEILRRVVFSVSTNSANPCINGVLFEQRGAECTIVTTDGHRLTMLEFNANNATRVLWETPESFSAMYSWPMLKALLTTTRGAIKINGDRVLSCSYDIIRNPYNDIEFPPYQQVIPKNPANSLVFDRKKMIKTINDAKKKVQSRDTLALDTLQDDTFLLRVPEDSRHDNVTDLKPFVVADNCIPSGAYIKLNTKFFYQPLSKSKAETMVLKFSGPLDPVVLESMEEFMIGTLPCYAMRTCIIMPRR